MRIYKKDIDGEDHWRATIAVQISVADRGFVHHKPKKCEDVSFEEYFEEAIKSLSEIKKKIDSAKNKESLIKKYDVKTPTAYKAN